MQIIDINNLHDIQQGTVGQPAQNAPELQIDQHSTGDILVQVHSTLFSSHPQQIAITAQSTHYAQTCFPFPLFIIRFASGKLEEYNLLLMLFIFYITTPSDKISYPYFRLEHRTLHQIYC